MAQGIFTILADEVTELPSSAAVDIVFVHGLGGDCYGTWQSSVDTFWPKWIAAKFPTCRVSTFGFDSKKLAGFFTGEGASLQDLAGILVDAMLSREDKAPHTLFICHSLGGLIVKQMLRRCADSADPDYRDLGRSVVGIAFLGTPHQGASLATAIERVMRHIMSKQSKQLAYGEDGLIELNEAFRSRVNLQSIEVRAFYETEKTGGVHIVDKVTANPGILGCEPIAVQTDHLSICKPDGKDAPVYKSVSSFISKLIKKLPAPANPVDSGSSVKEPQFLAPVLETDTEWSEVQANLSPDVLQDYEYFTTIAVDDRRSLADKLADVGRTYAIRDAERKKEHFNMALRRNIAQPAAVTRYTRLMSEVESRFRRHVARTIADGECAATIDRVIQSEVIDPCAALSGSTDEPLTAGLVDGALYYLAGNCHLAWDNV